MMADKILTFDIDVNSATGEAHLKGFGAAARQTAGEAQKADAAIGNQGLSGKFVDLKNAVGIFAASSGVFAAISFLKSCVTEAGNAELQMVRLTNALSHAGLGGEDLAFGLTQAADQLSRSAMIDDEVATGMMAVSVNMGLTAEQAQRLAQSSADAAAAMGKGPDSIAGINDALARAISSGSTRALRQLGINIDEVKFAAGDAEPLLRELQRRFSGAAAAEMDTYAGKVHIIALEYRNLKEAVGSFFLTYSEQMAAFMRFDIGKTVEPIEERLLKQIGLIDEADPKTQHLGTTLDNYAKSILNAVQSNMALDVEIENLTEGEKELIKTTEARIKQEEKMNELIHDHLTSVPRLNLLWRERAGMKEIPFSPFNVDKEFGQREQVSFWETMPEGWSPQQAPSESVFSQFPGEWTDATIAYAESLKEVGYNMREVIELGADFQANLDMQAAKSQTLADVTNMVTGAMAQFAGQLVYAALMGEQVTGRMLKSMLASIAAEATVKAIFELAEGWAAAANPVTAAEAPLHFMAAKIYGMVAGVAAAASMAFSGKTGTSMGRGYGGRTRSALAETTTQTPARNIQVTVYLEGKGILVNNTELARELAEEIQRQAGRSGQS